MKISGNDLGLNKLGLNNLNNVYRNLPVKDMVNDIINNGEGVVGLRGAAMVDTGIYTGRSPNDKYIVDEPNSTEKIWWGPVNRKVPEEVFDILYNKVVNYYKRSDDSKTYIFEPNAFNLLATFFPTFPKPTIPIFKFRMSRPNNSSLLKSLF